MKHAKDTAIHRTGPSAPLRWLLDHGYLQPGTISGDRAQNYYPTRVLDYGCGHGADVRHLRSLGYDAVGFDPFWLSGTDNYDAMRRSYDVVLCTYVLNVIPEQAGRDGALANIRRSLSYRGVAFVTVRRDLDADTETQRRIFLDFPLVFDGTDFAVYQVSAAN